tara:strand:+ start:707 stop:817 length:111 start_codon:yes stop_codon:yes gene_type:complete
MKKKILKLIKKYPNDYDLGEAIRKYFQTKIISAGRR